MIEPHSGCLFEGLFRLHLAVMLVLDPETLQVLDANDAALAFYGWTPGEIGFRGLGDICQDGPLCTLETLERCREGGGRVARCRHLAAGGEVRDVDIRISRIPSGERCVLFAVVSDVTALVRAENALRDSEERLRSICENTREGLFQVDLERRRYLWVNQAYARILGYESPGELLEAMEDPESQAWYSLEERERVMSVLLERGFLERHELRLRRRDGRAAWLSGSAWVVRGSGGEAARIEGVVEDITPRKRAEDERMLLATAVEQAAEGVAIVTGGSWLVEYANPAFGTVTGFERGEILGRDFFSLFGRGRQPLPSRDIREALLEGREWTGPVRDVKPGGQPLAAEAVFSPIRDATGRVGRAVVLLRDVSPLTRLENRLRRAQKLEAVGTLAGGIAHDFNNILTPILLNAEVGLQLVEQGDILRRPLEEIARAGGRARQLIRQVLVFSRQGDLRAERVDLAEIVREAARLLRERLPGNVALALDVDPESLPVLADPGLLHQVVVNLADNALHAMQEKGGVLGLRIMRRRGGCPEGAAESRQREGEHALLAVSDTGHGMDEALVERIFTPFFTTKRPGEGTGMGLSAVHGIIRSLGGGVRVESRLGEGSLFEVCLPLAGPVAPPGREPGGQRVLVVDAQAFSRRALAMILEGLGYKTTAMRDAAKALRVFARAPGRFRAVLAGEDLHGMSGRTFLKACRQAGRQSGLVLMADRDDEAQGRPAADAVVVKPVGAQALAQALDEALARAARRAGLATSSTE
ncbi:Sensor kinase CckA [Fundidesulfovibrio magnetotacticus]|uniref:histidine kinase n=1 Tax=Fundidesulfovibrio magnetotacticus TaxID=2730080 RepID=A0A6V8LSX3_9BACT|nr:PAS domain S-box protein [Fundidesulfovibrio magnetotacticus]GFK95572.1 Sensor kinase CckA [Fundidesulfovibrio magnetotacticus]